MGLEESEKLTPRLKRLGARNARQQQQVNEDDASGDTNPEPEPTRNPNAKSPRKDTNPKPTTSSAKKRVGTDLDTDSDTDCQQKVQNTKTAERKKLRTTPNKFNTKNESKSANNRSNQHEEEQKSGKGVKTEKNQFKDVETGKQILLLISELSPYVKGVKGEVILDKIRGLLGDTDGVTLISDDPG